MCTRIANKTIVYFTDFVKEYGLFPHGAAMRRSRRKKMKQSGLLSLHAVSDGVSPGQPVVARPGGGGRTVKNPVGISLSLDNIFC
ncbi:MAG: hypothetical protein AMJ54_17185 [Deltaproteobacteria bacterium SG8_13]|nr:MAG: hypothetical protein AMJ54_17185 [Deltaproteobacteria bacterium SG8_13]